MYQAVGWRWTGQNNTDIIRWLFVDVPEESRDLGTYHSRFT
jgi:hypothetical protein